MTDKNLADRTGRLHQGVDRSAARGIPGSAVAADGREQVRGVACPDPHDPRAAWHGQYYLSADCHLWCPDVRWDQKKIGRILEVAFPYAWSKNPSSGV